MTVGQISAMIAIAGGLATGASFMINKIISKVKHETGQDDKLNLLVTQRQECFAEREKQDRALVNRIIKLEESDTDRQMAQIRIDKQLESLLQGHEHTQAMILRLDENQNQMSAKLIETISSMVKR